MSAWPCRLCSRRDGGSPGRARVSSGPLVIRLDEERAQASSRATGNEKLGQANLAALLRPSPQASGPPENYVTTTVMADGPQAKRSKPGPPVAAVKSQTPLPAPLSLESNRMELTSVRNFPVSGTSSRSTCT